MKGLCLSHGIMQYLYTEEFWDELLSMYTFKGSLTLFLKKIEILFGISRYTACWSGGALIEMGPEP